MKKVATILLVIAMLVAMATPALANSNSQIVTGANTRIWQDGFGFHCNALKGNGATAVEYLGENAAIENSIAKIKKQPAGSLVVEKGDQKDIFGTKTFPITLERVGATTTWTLKTDKIECKTCGSTEWVTYSNNNGVINGKNIQAHHPPAPPAPPPPPEFMGTFTLEKTVEGKNILVWAAANDFDLSLLSFAAVNNATGRSYPGELNLYTGVIEFGEVPVGKYTVTETLLGVALDIFVNEGGVVRNVFFVGEDGVIAEDVSYISGKDFGTKVTAGKACPYGGPDRNWDLPAVWNNFFADSVYSSDFAELRGMGAEWVWNTEDTYGFGISGGHYEDIFTFVAHEDGSAKAYFAADNVAVVYLNGKLVGYTTVALRDELKIDDAYDADVLSTLDFSAFDGRWSEGWNHLYKIDIPYVAGVNTIQVIAANSISTGYYEGEVFIRGNTGTDNDTYNFTNNPCGFIFGFVLPGTTFDNKLNPTFEGAASFNKVKYGGALDVAAGEFEFDLFKIVDGVKVYHDTYLTDLNGVVSVENLEPGSYVFKEVLAVDHSTGNNETYSLVWKAIYPGDADGLYFEILANGDVVWANFNDIGNPTVNNVHHCKHNMLWVNTPVDQIGFTPEGGYTVVSVLGMCGTVEGGTIVSFNAWCPGLIEYKGFGHGNEVLWFGCVTNCGIGFGENGLNPCECDNYNFAWLTGEYGIVAVKCSDILCGKYFTTFDEDMWSANDGWDEPVVLPVCGVDYDHDFINDESTVNAPRIWANCSICGASNGGVWNQDYGCEVRYNYGVCVCCVVDAQKVDDEEISIVASDEELLKND